MFLNEIQSQKLDSILSAFGEEEYLDIKHVIVIEPIERKANGLIDVLKNKGLITRIGDTEEHLLPMLLLLNPSADIFIDNGGFTAEFHSYNSTKNQITINSTGNGNVINTGSNNVIDNSST